LLGGAAASSAPTAFAIAENVKEICLENLYRQFSFQDNWTL